MSTIHDVAEKAGVSVKTVSRVLNDYSHVSEKTRLRVQNAMETLNYSPSSIARQMRLGDTLSVGLMYGDPSSGYQSGLNQAFLEACFNAGRYLVAELLDETNKDWIGQVSRFLDKTKIKNLVLVPPLCDSVEVHELLRQKGVNFVLISPSQAFPSCVSIVIDEQKAAIQLTKHLIDQGHKRIAHISGDAMHVASLLRLRGYEKVLSEAGLEINSELVKEGSFDYKKALKCSQELLSLPESNRPTAIFCSNDEMAAATMMVASKMGFSVPDQLAIAGFDDSFISKVLWPQLTSVAQPFSKMALEAMQQLNNFPKALEFDPIVRVLPHKLHVRESSNLT